MTSSDGADTVSEKFKVRTQLFRLRSKLSNSGCIVSSRNKTASRAELLKISTIRLLFISDIIIESKEMNVFGSSVAKLR